MEKIEIRYKRMHLRWKFIFGLFWLILGIISITNNSENYFNYGYLIVSLLYFGDYIIKSNNQYLTIDSETMTMNSLYPKKVNLNDLILIEISKKNYILKTEISELTINTSLIEKNSLKDLRAILKNLKVNNN